MNFITTYIIDTYYVHWHIKTQQTTNKQKNGLFANIDEVLDIAYPIYK